MLIGDLLAIADEKTALPALCTLLPKKGALMCIAESFKVRIHF